MKPYYYSKIMAKAIWVIDCILTPDRRYFTSFRSKFVRNEQQSANGLSSLTYEPPLVGRVTVNVLPWLGMLAAAISPPCARAIALARLSPRPIPGFDRL